MRFPSRLLSLYPPAAANENEFPLGGRFFFPLLGENAADAEKAAPVLDHFGTGEDGAVRPYGLAEVDGHLSRRRAGGDAEGGVGHCFVEEGRDDAAV